MEAHTASPLEQVAPGIRRLLADNPSPFTYTGTQTYVVGERDIVVIDPGPDDPGHVAALVAALGDTSITAILVTHSHADHSPASRPLAAATGAPIVGCAPLALPDGGPNADAEFDARYSPDVVLAHGGRIAGDGWTLEAVATPGHTSNHLCFALLGTGALFSGDHVMGWSTSIVSPPDGDMADYMASLALLLARDDAVYYPTHGPAIDRPKERVAALIAHRRGREAQILGRIGSGTDTIDGMVAALYADLDPMMHPAAARSVLAHLIDLQTRGLARYDGEAWSRAA